MLLIGLRIGFRKIVFRFFTMEMFMIRATVPAPCIGMELIGMIDKPIVDCGTSLPVVRSMDDGSFHKVVRTGLPVWHDKSELETMVEDRCFSIFAQPLPFDQSLALPVILFASREFLTLVGIQLPKKMGDVACQWTTVKKTAVQTFAMCTPESVARQWLNECATIISQKFDEVITAQGQESDIDQEMLRQWAAMALCAASHQPLRFRLCVRYGSMMNDEQLQQLFNATISSEFRTMTQSNFEERATTFVSRLRERPAAVLI